MKHSVSIIVPTLNEEENINLLLQRIFAIPDLHQWRIEVIISDGASTDNTCARVSPWMKTHPVRLVTSTINEGLSAAVMAGARVARGEYTVVMDADLSHPPEVIPQLIAPLVDGSHDIVIGSRYIKGGATPDWPLTRRISSRIATLPARLLTDVKDPLAGLMALPRKRLAALTREVYGFKFGLELLATSESSLRVKEIPILFRDRCHGDSKMSGAVVLDYFRQLLILAGVYPLVNMGVVSLAILACLALVVDISVMHILLEKGLAIGWAHSVSFLVATASSLLTAVAVSRYSSQQPAIGIGHVGGVITATLATIVLRGGWLASIADTSLTLFELLMASIFAVGMSYLLHIFFIFSLGRKRIRGELVERYYGLGVVAFIVVLRISYSGALQLLPEEKYLFNLYQQVDSLAGLAALPLAAEIGGLLTELTMSHAGTFRLAALLFWLVAVAGMFALSRDMFTRAVAFKVVMLYAVLPFFMASGLFVTSDAIVAMFWSLSLYTLYRSLIVGAKNSWPWTGLILGFGVQHDSFFLVLLLGLVLYLLLIKEGRSWLSRYQPYVALVVFILSWIPGVLVSDIGGQIVPFKGISWITAITGMDIEMGLLLPLVLLSPTGVIAICCCCWQVFQRSEAPMRNGIVEQNRNMHFLLLFVLLPALAGCIFLLAGNGAGYCFHVVWLGLLPCIAGTIAYRGELPSGMPAVLGILWWPTIAVLVAVYAILLYAAAV